MNEEPYRVVHVAPWVTTGGGIETLLYWHRQEDVHNGLQARQIALFDRAEDVPADGYSSLRIGWRNSLKEIRRRFANAMAENRGATVVYHNGWGLPLFGDLDGSARRLVYLHAGFGFLKPFLPALGGWVDGVVGINRTVPVLALSIDSAMAAERCVLLRAPAQPPPAIGSRHGESGKWVIGYSGRLERLHKRVDRLPTLLRELDRIDCTVRLEVLGDGPARTMLQRAAGSQVVFHGWKTGDDYWRVLREWDAIVFFSDSEGGPLAMVEAMALGVIPFFPAIGGSLGDEYAPQIDARCYYPAADIGALAQRIKVLRGESTEVTSRLRQRARDLAAMHRADTFGADFAALVRRVAQLPRVSRKPGLSRQARAADALPLGFVTRYWQHALWR